MATGKRCNPMNQLLPGLRTSLIELTIEQNHLMKDFELYKKAFKHHELEQREVFAHLLGLITDIVKRIK